MKAAQTALAATRLGAVAARRLNQYAAPGRPQA